MNRSESSVCYLVSVSRNQRRYTIIDQAPQVVFKNITNNNSCNQIFNHYNNPVSCKENNFLRRIQVPTVGKRFLQLKRSLCDYSFLIWELYHCKLGLNCRSPSKGHLTAVNYMLFLKVKINSVIIFTLKTLFPKFLHQVWFISFSVDYAMNRITENALNILLKEYNLERIVLSAIIC